MNPTYLFTVLSVLPVERPIPLLGKTTLARGLSFNQDIFAFSSTRLITFPFVIGTHGAFTFLPLSMKHCREALLTFGFPSLCSAASICGYRALGAPLLTHPHL